MLSSVAYLWITKHLTRIFYHFSMQIAGKPAVHPSTLTQFFFWPAVGTRKVFSDVQQLGCLYYSRFHNDGHGGSANEAAEWKRDCTVVQCNIVVALMWFAISPFFSFLVQLMMALYTDTFCVLQRQLCIS